MAIKTTWSCDKCNAAQDVPDQMWSVAVSYEHIGRGSVSPWRSRVQMWCSACMEKHGILPPPTAFVQDAPKPPPPSPPSFEDLVREICRDEIQNRTGA
jgi:hypothetical protein